MKSWPSFLTITLLRSTKHVLLKFWWFIDLSYFDVLRLRDRNRGSFLELVVSDMDSSSLTWNDQPGLISPANILGIYESMSPAMGKTHLARQLEVQCKQEHQRPMLSRKQAQEVLPVVKSQRLDICQMWFLLQITNAGMFELELLECFNTLCMWWNWLILKAMHFFSALEKREADVNSLDCWCPPPSLSSKNRQRDMRHWKWKERQRYKKLSEHFHENYNSYCWWPFSILHQSRLIIDSIIYSIILHGFHLCAPFANHRARCSS